MKILYIDLEFVIRASFFLFVDLICNEFRNTKIWELIDFQLKNEF